jgi:hypothetical protein
VLEGGPAVVVDIDGVVADATHRQWYLRADRRDWDGFFAACRDDPPIDATVSFLSVVDADVSVLLLTARPHWVAAMTADWLVRHGIRWDLLVTRSPVQAYMRSSQFKRDEVTAMRALGFDLLLAIDDDERNVEMFRAEGLPTMYHHSGYYD